jgi:hypothetical protein
MSCSFHRWLLSHAADARRAAPRATQRHLAACAGCRAYAALCTRLPRALAAGVPEAGDSGAAQLLRQRILARTTQAPAVSRPWKPHAPVFPSLGKTGEIFSNPWQPALAAAALVCVLLAAGGLVRQHVARAQQQTTLAALQAVRLACDDALQQGPAAVAGLLDTAAQHIAADAASAVAFLGAALPPAAQPNRS